MALTDAQAKIIAANKKKKNKGNSFVDDFESKKQKRPSSSSLPVVTPTKTVKNEVTTPLKQGKPATKRKTTRITANHDFPRTYMPGYYTDAVGRHIDGSNRLYPAIDIIRDRIAKKETAQTLAYLARVRGEGTRKERYESWQEALQKAAEERVKRQEKLKAYTLSEQDSGLPLSHQQMVREAKAAWEKAKKAGDTEGMRKAHEKAEAMRMESGYSGGVTGDEYLPAKLTKKDEYHLNQVGRNKLKKAMLDRQKAIEAGDVQAQMAASYEIQRIRNDAQYKNKADSVDGHGRPVENHTMTAEELKEAEHRFQEGLYSTMAAVPGSVLSFLETTNQAIDNDVVERNRAYLQEKANRLNEYKIKLEMVRNGEGNPAWGSESWLEQQVRIAENAKRLLSQGTNVNPNLPGQTLMRKSGEAAAEALKGVEGWKRDLAGAAMAVGQNIPALALTMIPGVGTALGLGMMGTQAAGSRAWELNEQNSDAAYLASLNGGNPEDYGAVDPAEASFRGLLSGLVEAGTGFIPLGRLTKLLKGKGGQNFLKNVLEQMGLEGAEEGAAYTANFLLDKAYQDPNAAWTPEDLWQNVKLGALAGGMMAGGGSVVGGMVNRTPSAPAVVLPQGGTEKKAGLPTAEEADRQQRAARAESDKRPSRREQPGWTGADGQSPGRAPHQSAALTASPQGEALSARVGLPGVEGKPGVGNRRGVTELERSGILAGAEEGTIRQVGDLARKLNREVRFFRGESWENGRYDPNTGILHLNTNGRNPIMQVFAHELTHSIEQADSYDKLAEAILNSMDEAELNARFQEITQRYQEKGVFLEDPAEVMNEVVAEYVETRLLTDYEAISSLVQTDRSLGQRILAWIDSMLAKLGSTAAQERAALTEARGLYSKALQETSKGGGTKERETPMVPPQTPSGGLTRAPQKEASEPGVGNRRGVTGAHAQTEGTIPQSASQTAPFAQGSLLEGSGSQGEKGWEDLLHDPYMEALGEQLRTGEISEEEFDRLFDEYYHGGSEVFDYDTEETPKPMKYSISPEEIQAVQSIENQQLSAKGSDVSALAQSISAADIHTVADLFAAVKGRDKHFGKKAQDSVDKKRNPGKHTATDESQRFRYQKPRTGDTQSGISTEPSIPNDGRNVKHSISGEGESQPGRTWTRETLPAKARDQLDRTERAMVDRLGKAMDVPVKARQTSLREIARELGETYLSTGRIDQETADRLFETAWEKGVVEDRAYYDQYKPIKDRLRTLPLRISEEDSHDIVDYVHFKKAARGVLHLVKDGGTPVDVAYEEMKQTAPELFPAGITHPADQLVQMYEVARGIQKTEKSLADHYGPEAETYKAYAKNDFCEQVYDAVADWKLVRRYADDRAEELEQKAGRVVLDTPEQVKAAWKSLKEDRKAYEKVMAKNLLTDHDKVQVGRLLKGELEPEHLEPGKDNVKGILEVWKAREAYERDRRAIAEWNKGRKDQLRGEADRLLATANSWKDKKMGLQYAAETMERNIRDIVPDKDLAEEIIQTYFAPVHTAQAESTRLKNRMRQRVKELDLNRKVKDGNLVSEAHAVQLYGEAMDNIQMLKNSRGRMKHRDGKTLEEWEAVVTKLWEENPNLDKGKIQRAVEEFRKIYDNLFEQMNEARIRNGYEPTNYRKGYFPHFQPGHTDGITGMFANVLGISTEITALPTTIAGMTHTFKPGIRWFGNAQERLGFNTAYDAVEGFDKYIEGVADVICQTDNIQRLRALASQTRYRTSDEGIRKQVDAVLANESLSDQDKENRIRDIYENGRFALSNFVINLDEYTNLLANKRSLHDRSMEQDFGRKAYNLVRWLEGRVGANMVAINPGSWLTNLIPLTQGGAQLGSGQLMKGMWETLQAYAGKSSQDFVDRSTFLTNRRGSDPLVPRWAELADTNTKPKQILRKAGEVTGKAGDFLAMGMEYIDNFTADTLVRARYNQNLKRGLSETAALEEADAWAAGVMADRSKGATPTLFSRTNPGTKLFTQFQLEVNNQLRYLFKDIPRQEAQRGAAFVAGTILKFFLGAWLYDEVYEYFLGRRPAMDPIGILNDTVGDLTGWELPNLVELGAGAVKGEVPSFQTEKPGTYEAITGAAKEMAGQIPFVGGLLGGGRLPVSNAIPNAGNLLKAATNEDWSPEKRWDTVAKELWKPLSYVVLPTGGGQIKKVIQGANAVRKGGSYTVDAEGNEILQYPVYGDTPWEMVKSLGQATVFGKTTLPTGKDWVERNFQNLSARETAAYRELTEEMDSDSRTVYETLRAMKAEKDDSGKRSVLAEADLTDREMQVIYNYLFGEKQPEGGYISSRDEDITALAEVGLGMDEFLTIQNQYAAINKMDGKADAKAVEFARWVNTQGYSQEESAAIQEAFRYYYQMPADAARYNEMTASGLDDETAAGITASLDALEPLEGATQVSDAQKYRVVVDAGISGDKQMEVLGGMMQEAEYTRLQVGRQHGGVAPTEYVQFLEMKPLYDEDGNGSFKQAEVTALLKAMNISNSSKAALWQMANKSWKPGKNPFSVDVGAKVYEGLNGG